MTLGRVQCLLFLLISNNILFSLAFHFLPWKRRKSCSFRSKYEQRNKVVTKSSPSSSLFYFPTSSPPPHSNDFQNNTAISPSINFIILQHAKEVERPSGTAKLILENNVDSSYHSLFQDDGKMNENANHDFLVNVSRWVWSGRKDNIDIAHKLDELLDKHNHTNNDTNIFLVWTGGSTSIDGMMDDYGNGGCKNQTRISNTFIILDGTWKEAQIMFRKMPFLQSLQRLSLNGVSTTYTIRSDYTNWRKKNARGMTLSDEDVLINNDLHLLCTAETCAVILRRFGYEDNCNNILSRLDQFQCDFRKGLNVAT